METDLSANKNLAQLAVLLINEKLTLAVAESCTSGLIQNVLSQAEEAMAFYQGGITAYNAGQKTTHLHVNPIAADACNSVSKEIAEKMAIAVAGKFSAEVGLSITGYAMPVPDENILNCYAYIAVSKKGQMILSKRIKGDVKKSLPQNQLIYAVKAIDELLKIMKKRP
ncbi:MAG: nicotinamide-nucleotide amidohydrolase family protein [Weeksellaceae bacterium]|nr:nicotinamide-nucleotide amidohydrolase family protein [Weeksellaceae bacterium]